MRCVIKDHKDQREGDWVSIISNDSNSSSGERWLRKRDDLLSDGYVAAAVVNSDGNGKAQQELPATWTDRQPEWGSELKSREEVALCRGCQMDMVASDECILLMLLLCYIVDQEEEEEDEDG